jgi:hypothetical protein
MKLKRLFLYGSLGSYFFCAFPMENNLTQKKIDNEVQRVFELVEQNHLNKYLAYWPIIRRYYLYCDAISLNKNQVAGEISIIEYYISGDVDQERVLEKLKQQHWYVAFLMNVLVEKAIAKINKVRGSKIDVRCDQFMNTLWNNTDVSAVESIVYNRVIEHFYSELDSINNISLEGIPQDLRGIYFTVLKGVDQIESSSLSISSDDTYLRATDYNKNQTIWDTASGKMITNVIDLHNIKHRRNIHWIPAERDKDFFGYDQDGEKYSVATPNCYATIKNLPILDMMQQSSSYIGCETKVITLFKKPELSLYLYQKAFDNSKNSLEELIALRDSKNFADIKGFAQENLKQYITKRINQLTAETIM